MPERPMRPDTWFRLSVYLTLGLASLCLGQAEDPFLPGMLPVSAGAGLIFGFAFLLEGRWALSLLAANLLGVVIAIAAGSWIVYHTVNPPAELATVAPWPAMLLPYFG